eukprot:3756117-Amphidinium_carterae.1
MRAVESHAGGELVPQPFQKSHKLRNAAFASVPAGRIVPPHIEPRGASSVNAAGRRQLPRSIDVQTSLYRVLIAVREQKASTGFK